MATTIINKIGSGEPSDNELKQGELGIDITNQVIWTYSEAKAKMVQLAGGDIKWEHIVDVPLELQVIINGELPGYNDINSLAEQVTANKEAIAALNTWKETVDTELERLAGLIQTNSDNIATNAGNIATNVTNIASNGLAISALDTRVTVNEEGIKGNLEAIDDIKDLLDANLNGLVFGGEYDALNDKCENLTDAGLAAGLVEGSNVPPSAETTKGIYLIITTAGQLTGMARAEGDQANVGDWIVSDGIEGWLHLELGQGSVTFSMIEGDPEDNTKLAASLDAKIDVEGTINCGQYS